LGVFDGVTFLDKWVTHFEDEKNALKDVNVRMEKLGDYFFNTFCSFVLQDLTVLLERYMRKSRESFSRLQPKKK